MKKAFFHGIISGVLASAAGIIYFHIYQTTLGTAFDKIVNWGSISGISILACMIIALGYWLLEKFNKENLKGIYNVVIALLSFASIISPISMSLPLDIKNPELFPGLVVPMHFFPALSFFCLQPFFKNKEAE